MGGRRIDGGGWEGLGFYIGFFWGLGREGSADR